MALGGSHRIAATASLRQGTMANLRLLKSAIYVLVAVGAVALLYAAAPFLLFFLGLIFVLSMFAFAVTRLAAWYRSKSDPR